MRAVDSNVLSLLKVSLQFVIPVYHRGFVWGPNEWSSLWERVLAAGRSGTLGPLLLGLIAHMPADSSRPVASRVAIVDGSQRLITVASMLAALAAVLEELPVEEREPVVGFSPEKIRGRYLLNGVESGSFRYKILPEGAHRLAVAAVLNGQAGNLGEDPVVGCYRYFFERLQSSPVTSLQYVKEWRSSPSSAFISRPESTIQCVYLKT